MSISSSSQFPPVIHTPYSPPPVGPSVNASKAPEPNDDATDDKGSERPSRSTNSVSTASALTGSSTSASGASSQPTTNGAGVVNGQIDKLEQSSEDSEKVFAQKPGLMQKLTEDFSAKHPNVPRPIDLTKIYVNSYRTTWVPGHNDENGVQVPGKTVRTLVSSKSVADWITDKYASGKGVNPLDNDILENSTLGRGMYSDPTAVEEGAEIKGLSVSNLQDFLDRPGGGDNLEQTAIDQSNEYYSQPNSLTGGLSVKQWLVNTRKEQILTEADLRVGDGTLQPKSKKLIDTVIANPTPAELEKLPEDKRPSVTPLGIRLYQNAPVADAPIPGAFYISTPQAAGEGSGNDDAAVVLYIPGEGLREFDSEAALSRYISARSGNPEERKSLLNLMPAQERSAVGEKIFNLSPSNSPIPRIAANRNFFEFSVQGQIDQQNADIRYEFGQAKGQRADLNVFDAIAKSANAPLRQSFDTKGVMEERNAQLVTANVPAWRVNATEAQLLELEACQEQKETSEQKFRDVMKKKEVPTIQSFASKKINNKIANAYPGWRVYPETVTIVTTTLTPGARPPGAGGSSGSPTSTTKTEKVSLTDFFLNNNPPWDPKLERRTVSVNLIDSKGNRKTVSGDELTNMVTELNVGQAYEDELKKIFLSSEGTDIRDAWKEYHATKMKVEAYEAKLQGVFSEDSPERPAYDWVQSVIQYPDEKTRPKINGKEIKAEALIIGGEQSGGLDWGRKGTRDGFSVDGVMIIGPKNGPVVLYAPDAPDGKTMRVFNSREEMQKSPELRTPEMVAYFKARVSLNGRATVARLEGPARKPGPVTVAEMYAYLDGNRTAASIDDLKQDVTFRGPPAIGTAPISGNVQDKTYEAHAGMLIANADTQSTTNGERFSESALNVFDTVVDIVSYLLMMPGVGKLASQVKGLFRYFRPRSQLLKFKTLPRLFKKRGLRGEDTIELLPRSRTSSSASSHSSRSLSADIDPTKLKSVSNGIFVDPATNKQYFLYRSTWVEAFSQGEKFFIRDPQNPLEPIEMKKIGEEWVPQLPEEVAIPEKPSKTLAERNAELPTDLSSRPFDAHVLKNKRVDIKNYLSAKGHEQIFSNLMDIEVSKGHISLADRTALLSKSDPYERAGDFLDIVSSRSRGDIKEFPEHIRQAIRNGEEVRVAQAKIPDLIAQEQKKLADLPEILERNVPADSAAQGVQDLQIRDVLALDSNKDAFANWIDIETSKGRLSLTDRAALLSEPNPHERALKFVRLVRSSGGKAEFPKHIRQAISNGEEVRVAKAKIPNLIAQEKKKLADLPEILERNVPADSAAQDVQDLQISDVLALDSNKDAFAHLIDVEASKGHLTAEDILQLKREPNPQERALKFVRLVRSNGGKAEFPESIRQAIRNADEVRLAQSSTPSIVAQQRTKLADLPEILEKDVPANHAAQYAQNIEVAKVLAANGNKDTFARLIDIEASKGHLPATDILWLKKEPDPYKRALKFVQLVRSSGGKAEFPESIRQAIRDTPE